MLLIDAFRWHEDNETQLTTPQQANNAYYPAPQAQFNAVAPAPYSPQYATPENQHATPQSINNTYFPAPQAQLNAVSPAPYPPQYAIPENKHTSLQPANNAYYPAPQAQLNAVAPVSYPPQYVTPETQKAPDTIMNVGPGVYNNPVQSAVTEQRAQGSVVPLYALAFSPALVDCPQCSQRGMTVIDYINGTTTQLVQFN